MLIKYLSSSAQPSPIIAILRGVQPREVTPICEALLAAGIQGIEIPLNSPDPYASIKKLVDKFSDRGLIGAGTVLNIDQVDRLHEIGARLLVMPNTNPPLIRHAASKKMLTLPGAMTPTEIFQAIEAGACGVKLFPARTLGIEHFIDVNAVLPRDFPVFAVGGVDAANAFDWLEAGAAGIGVGSSLYRTGDSAETVHDKALSLLKALGIK